MMSQAKESGALQRFREGCVYTLFEDLTRLILSMDKDRICAMDMGKDLWKIAGLCKENARYAMQRIMWVEEGRHEWTNICSHRGFGVLAAGAGCAAKAQGEQGTY